MIHSNNGQVHGAHRLTERGYRRTMEKSPVAPTHARFQLGMGNLHLSSHLRVHDSVLMRAREPGCGVQARRALAGLSGVNALHKRRGTTKKQCFQGVTM